MEALHVDVELAVERPALLFLCHRIPFPPNKGDKIRSFNMLKALSRHFAVHLGTFVDEPADWAFVDALKPFCASVRCEPLTRRRALLRSAMGLLEGSALGLPYYRNAKLTRWVEDTIRDHQIERVFVFSSVMAQFMPQDFQPRRLVVDFVDVDSDKWLQYATTKAWPLSWLYRREGNRLLDWEVGLASQADASLFVSDHEAALFRELHPDDAGNVGHIENGVDTEFFNPEHAGSSPYPAAAKVLVFTGAMDYWPNVDAVVHFAHDILPALRSESPELQFWIVGVNPAAEVQALAGEGIVVTGRVEDVRPYLAHALAAVAPLRIARGVQNKVLEAMAMARPVLVSRRGLEGIHAENAAELSLCDTAAEYLRALRSLNEAARDAMGQRARIYVCAHANWEANLAALPGLLDGAHQRSDQHSHQQLAESP